MSAIGFVKAIHSVETRQGGGCQRWVK